MNPIFNTIQEMVEAVCASANVTAYAVVDIDRVRRDIQNECIGNDILTDGEKKLYTDCRILKRKADWLSGRLAAKKAVAAILKYKSSHEVEILRSKSGAPLVAGHNEISVSISHSGSAAISVAAPFRVGIDLEVHEKRPQSFIRAILSDREQALIAHGKPDWALREITRLWTCKEAVAKVCLCGGAVNFKSIDCCNNPVSIDTMQVFHRYKSSESYAVTLAYQGCKDA